MSAEWAFALAAIAILVCPLVVIHLDERKNR